MKKLILVTTLFFTISLQASLGTVERKFKKMDFESVKDLHAMGNLLIKNKLYFSAIYFFKQAIFHSTKTSKALDRDIDTLINHVGLRQFEELPIDQLYKSQSAFLQFTLGKRYFQQKNFPLALKTLKHISKRHIIYPQTLQIAGAIWAKKNKSSRAIKTYKRCARIANKYLKKFDEKHPRRKTLQFVKNSCEIAIPRILYKARKYASSKRYYNAIPIESYKWPDQLFEMSWNAYQQKDYNTSIGKLLTFKSPILQDHYYPQADVLWAMGYYKMCYFDDMFAIIQSFEKNTVPGARKLLKLLKSKAKDPRFFVGLVLNDRAKVLRQHPLLKSFVKRIRTGPAFFSQAHFFQRAVRELKFFSKQENQNRFTRTFKRNLQVETSFTLRSLNTFVQRSLFKFFNEIIITSKQISLLKLEYFSNKRQYFIDKKEFSGTGEGEMIHINLSDKENYWDFAKEFWVDELGHYVLGLESRCTK